ncbi:MAG: ATP-binding protein [Gammaproteobacteria bacterium]|nr:ATP-binding protein [Gammaproteobacteria bacterium]MDH5801696.1 ATP-binding protein [Gammaproteobacteria bacterium]
MRRPRLHTLLFLVNLAILVLPLSGIALLRVYESVLVRQTESELIAQGVFVKEIFKNALLRQGLSPQQIQQYSLPMESQTQTTEQSTIQVTEPASRWKPRAAKLDLSKDTILGKPSDPLPATHTPHRSISEAGAQTMAIMRNAQITTLAAMRLVDSRGTVIASTNQSLQQSLMHWPEVSRALQGQHVSLMRRRISDEPVPPLQSISRGAGVRVFVAMPVLHDDRIYGAVVLSRTPANIMQALHGKRYELAYAALLIVGVVLFITLVTSLTISNPVRAVIAQTQRAVRGEKGAVTPLESPYTHEVAELSQAVAHMALTLEQRADYIRDFAAHVSHEFKTPLTAIKGAVELLQDHSEAMTAEEKNRFLQNLNNDASRLENLVQKLLELAKADTMVLGQERTLITPVLQSLQETYRHAGLPVELQFSGDSLAVNMDEATLSSVFTNLLENTRQHGGHQAKVHIVVKRSQENVSIVYQDNGTGISSANAKKIFQPFFTTARNNGGTGLGLAVVQSILKAHNGQIRLTPSQQGVRFELELAPAPST